jgi:hypothetical protein
MNSIMPRVGASRGTRMVTRDILAFLR